MKLKRFSFINHKTGWHVSDVNLGSLSLLVGASGVGKTLILKAISDIARIANGKSLNGLEWDVNFEEDGIGYRWSGRFEVVNSGQQLPSADKSEFYIIEERLATNDGVVIFSRDNKEIRYHDTPTVKLDTSKSAVELLKEEPDVAPVKKAFNKILWLDMEVKDTFRVRPGLFSPNESALSIKEIKSLKFYNVFEKLFLIHKSNKEVFDQIKEAFIEVFPLIEDIDFDLDHLYKDDYVPVLKIKEKYVRSWIKYPDISSGMCRTLIQIVTLVLAEDGEVIMIDEFENGLGINCIDILADMAKEHNSNVQIIMTSHHPYIINSIPFRDWIIVSRKGSEVRVNTASDLRIGEHSRHDAFMQLIQTEAYRTGQA